MLSYDLSSSTCNNGMKTNRSVLEELYSGMRGMIIVRVHQRAKCWKIKLAKSNRIEKNHWQNSVSYGTKNGRKCDSNSITIKFRNTLGCVSYSHSFVYSTNKWINVKSLSELFIILNLNYFTNIVSDFIATNPNIWIIPLKFILIFFSIN